MVKSKRMKQSFKFVITALLVALNVVLERFIPSYKTDVADISFGFIAIAFAAAFLGTPYAAVVAGLGDVIGAILVPFGAYFPGFTVTNCIYGIILGEFLHKNANAIKIVICVLLNKLVCSVVLNTMWVTMVYYGGLDAFWGYLSGRILGIVINATVELIILFLVFSKYSPSRKTLDKHMKKLI